MVPFIDVMLVLLIIFMVTAPLITTGMVDLPTVGRSSQRPDHVIEVVVAGDAALRVRVDGIDRGTATPDSIAQRVARRSKASRRRRSSSRPTRTSSTTPSSP
jgi:biopolymer transport protein TolR